MVLAVAVADLTALIIALATLVTAIATLRTARQTHGEVTTLNGQTMAMLADNTETRRIEDMAAGDRSAVEHEHMDKMQRGKS